MIQLIELLDQVSRVKNTHMKSGGLHLSAVFT